MWICSSRFFFLAEAAKDGRVTAEYGFMGNITDITLMRTLARFRVFSFNDMKVDLDSGSSRFLEVAKEEQPPSFMDPWKQY
jgi:hypothetical protein